MSFDMVIRGARVVTPERAECADIGIIRGRIAAIGHDLGPAAEVIEAQGLIAMVDGIDSHGPHRSTDPRTGSACRAEGRLNQLQGLHDL